MHSINQNSSIIDIGPTTLFDDALIEENTVETSLLEKSDRIATHLTSEILNNSKNLNSSSVQLKRNNSIHSYEENSPHVFRLDLSRISHGAEHQVKKSESQVNMESQEQ